ncbi:hypothetical protein GON03_17735 [Nocardioides sp. MAH-18]|uniref:Pyridoxamine 5'-phosphate oxidase-like domain-containing protein n=1 Tax=Nocardioides agri TaxID=2682843 RepID=A0A6L6XUZ4_9ACTN|nr:MULTISPECIES: hypothetical protein [unclassified Nocardioides]MBA2956185.1 hypothetical protein [Nocardioides sp. CGMCC 1.13656]MVQ51029.1 hypothetical protein [Nocardioides sp. MAH-18]
MSLSPEDEKLLANMKQRELHLKRRERAADAIHYRVRRYRTIMSILAALAFSAAVTGLVVLVAWIDPAPTRWGRALPVIAAGAFGGALLGEHVWETSRGRWLLAREESRLREKYSGDLHAGRRWLQFYYRGEDISAYVPQILYFIESEGRFDSVAAALAFAQERRHESAVFAARARERFNDVAAQTNTVILSSTDEMGHPSSRTMRFVRTDRPGVWLVTTAPEGPKVHELDGGKVALVTLPTESGAAISTNRLRIRRSTLSFTDVVELYRAQVPGYVDGMSEAEQERELVYELTLQSAKVDTWLEHDVVDFET